MTGLIMKLILCPILLLITNYIFGLGYTFTQALIVGIVLAIVAHMMEVLILKNGTFWVSTISDFVVAFAIIYLSQFVFMNVIITFWGALITSLLLTVVEYFEHNFLIKSGRTKKGAE
ncbi:MULTISPECIES: DUF2512 family protein [unclassified Clostridium]|uniref:DUF2512 family protein n=1 Tax=unclassified Clostridium TaxID=2614128 RepID=UPI000297F91A|nr:MULTISPECIES: DUF2512 family protein [unclassified Clostridium]EKQ51433.1 MAG: Protein of unknown function (DUF2512) [Clostridium sp. Maddingley MBC34-26]